MSKKIYIFSIFLLFAAILFQCRTDACIFKKKHIKDSDTVLKNSSYFAPKNNVNGNIIWVGTFQLVWNNLIDEVIKKPVELCDDNSETVKILNKKGFNKEMLSEDSYYIKNGYMKLSLKKEIEDALKEKFNDKSDILDSFQWSENNFLIYAILKKDFKFLKAFEKLDSENFEGTLTKFYGIKKDGKKELKDNVNVLFYENSDNFAISLNTKENTEDVIFFRSNKEKTFEDILKILKEKQDKFEGNKFLTSYDSVKIPYIKFDKMFSYKELENKRIKNTDFIITSAIQTVKFKMDNEGGSLKSEAAIVMLNSALRPIEIQERKFYFNKPFYLILKEKGQETPYFITYFKNADLLEKE